MSRLCRVRMMCAHIDAADHRTVRTVMIYIIYYAHASIAAGRAAAYASWMRRECVGSMKLSCSPVAWAQNFGGRGGQIE